MAKPFLTAQWKNLVMINYAVDPELLSPFVPGKCEIDLYEGEALVSLVAFQFLQTRVLGIKIPWHVNFPEVNLRMYLKREVSGEIRRGVSFIAEIVPRRAITLVANTLYDENYITRPMTQRVTVRDDSLYANYTFRNKGQENSIMAETELKALAIEPGTMEYFITEHYYGYTKGKRTKEYRVDHPTWRSFALKNYSVKVDFAAVYGTHWHFLNGATPHSALVAEGSEISVFPNGKI